MTQDVHGPYHFVPLSQWVYMPDWAHLVSHDVPFKEGHCGVIEYSLTNATPLCMGDQQQQQQDGSALVKFARDPHGSPIIPSSSLKGMLRSVMEIASFGKFSQVDDQRFSFRELVPKSYYLTNVIQPNKVQAGWISYDVTHQRWQFMACNHCKIAHKQISEQLNIKVINASSAVEKYTQLPLSQSISAQISAPKGKQKKCWAEQLNNGDTTGHIVFTNERVFDENKGKAENYEFSYFFYAPQAHQILTDIQSQISDLFTNHQQDQVDYLKRCPHPKLGLPVFALIKNKQLHSLGFAQMPRVTYQCSTQELIDKQSPTHQSDLYFDMAELIFGTLREQGLGLKSRVYLSDAHADDVTANELYYSHSVILNNPKPTFYPAYIEQTGDQHPYSDYNQGRSLAGFKRYIAKRPTNNKLSSNAINNENKKVASALELCPTGKHFSGKIVFHNLTPIELGALLWVMQLENGAYHQLGHGKPMGAGAISLTPRLAHCTVNDGVVNKNSDDFIQLFIEHMEAVHPQQQWRESPQLSYLLALATLDNNHGVNTEYMQLKQFQNAKKKEANYAKLEPFKGINRRQSLAMNNIENATSLAFGCGRLSLLLDDIDTSTGWVNQTLNGKRMRLQRIEDNAAQLRQQQQQAERKASMSPHAWRVEELQQQLEHTENQDRRTVITDAIDYFLTSIDKAESQACEALHQLARQYNFHKQPKRRIAENRALLAKLLAAYGVE